MRSLYSHFQGSKRGRRRPPFPPQKSLVIQPPPSPLVGKGKFSGGGEKLSGRDERTEEAQSLDWIGGKEASRTTNVEERTAE